MVKFLPLEGGRILKATIGVIIVEKDGRKYAVLPVCGRGFDLFNKRYGEIFIVDYEKIKPYLLFEV